MAVVGLEPRQSDSWTVWSPWWCVSSLPEQPLLGFCSSWHDALLQFLSPALSTSFGAPFLLTLACETALFDTYGKSTLLGNFIWK